MVSYFVHSFIFFLIDHGVVVCLLSYVVDVFFVLPSFQCSENSVAFPLLVCVCICSILKNLVTMSSNLFSELLVKKIVENLIRTGEFVKDGDVN